MIKIALIIFCLFVSTARSESVPSSIGPIYYKIGGGRAVGSPLTGFDTIKLTVGFTSSFGYSCGQFNPHETVTQMINQIKDSLRELPSQLTAAFTSAMVSLPGYLLKRAYPGLYGIITQTLDKSFELFQISVKNCRQIEKEMNSMGEDFNPYQNLIQASVAERYEFEIGLDDGRTLDQIEEEVSVEVGNNGVRWLDGVRYAGLDQDPIRFNRDLVVAGYNTLIGRAPTSETDPPDSPLDNEYIVKVWGTPLDAAEFLVDIVGESELKTDNSGTTTTKAGRGVRPFVDLMTENIQSYLQAAVEENDWAELRDVDAMGVAVPVVEAIRKEPPYLRALMISKVASEMAVAETQERITLIKQLLNAGLKNADITASKASSIASTHVRKTTIPELDNQVEDMLKAYEFKSKALHSTALVILEYGHKQSISAAGKEPPATVNPNTVRQDGGVDSD
ncbi:hypothetical protein [Hahella ganghwensis]|uniref:hypothetical protein n=1 Tax=Hahella ganghwensis TaxID=286420 RepID=UPI0012FA857D|nr:hypothetical protein [Hahella ganghwensis]